MPAERIVRLGGDNFWQAGAVGPCGPCSELHYDRGAEFGCDRAECAPDCDCDRFLEFWNLVFMQYNMLDDGSLEPLPRPSIDTGCGVERMTMLAEGVDSVYLTDAFGDVIEVIESWSGARYGHTPDETKALQGAGRPRPGHDLPRDRRDRAGQRGRGYVLRRVIRRAMLQAAGSGSRTSSSPAARARGRAAGRGLPRADQPARPRCRRSCAPRRSASRARSRPAASCWTRCSRTGGEVSAEDAFRLHDTYGFPFELTVEIAAEHGKRVDEAGFAPLMDEQRNRARGAIAVRARRGVGAARPGSRPSSSATSGST